MNKIILEYTLLEHDTQVIGKKWILCFYGFGQNENSFTPLLHKIKSNYSILIIHLPYEKIEESWSKNNLCESLLNLLNDLDIENYIGISYSIGSRINLCLAEGIPEKIKQLILIAPDGIKTSFWNQLALSTQLSKKIFFYLTAHQSLLPNLLNLLSKFNILKKSIYSFAKWHTRDIESRKRIYNTWINLQYIIPNLKTINQNIVSANIPTIAFFGINDAVINHSIRKRLSNYIPSTKIITKDKGHKLLDENLFADIASYLI
jgi:pimeloyl-ACP methyl ester carboxylesterase